MLPGPTIAAITGAMVRPSHHAGRSAQACVPTSGTSASRPPPGAPLPDLAAAGCEPAGASPANAYSAEPDSAAPAGEPDRLLAVIDDIAEVPRAVRAGPPV